MQTDSSAMRISKAWCEDRSNVVVICAPIIATTRSSQPNALQQQPSKASLGLLLRTLLQNFTTEMRRRRPCDAPPWNDSEAIVWCPTPGDTWHCRGLWAPAQDSRGVVAVAVWIRCKLGSHHGSCTYDATWMEFGSWDVSLTAVGLKLIQK